MGAWGYGIFDDDFTCDIKADFEELIDEGTSIEDATSQLFENYSEFIEEDENDYASFYVAVSKILIEKKSVTDDIKTETLRIIDEGVGLELWEEDKDGLEQRKIVLENLKKELLNM